MIPIFDTAKIRVRLNKTSPELNLSRLRELSRSLYRSSISNVMLEQSIGPQPYEIVGNVFRSYGLIADEKFQPFGRTNKNGIPRSLRWIDKSQYVNSSLKGYNWSEAVPPSLLPPFYMVLEKMKYWPSNTESVPQG